MAGVPVTLTDDAGRVRFEGRQVGGGGSMPHTAEGFGLSQNYTPQDDILIPWASPTGDPLLDLSDPTLPTVVDAGVYALNCLVNITPFAPPGATDYFSFAATLDASGLNASIVQQLYVPVLAGSHISGVTYSLTPVGFVPAGGQIALEGFCDTAAVNVALALSITLQRIS